MSTKDTMENIVKLRVFPTQSMQANKRVNIAISSENYLYLKSMGKMGQSFNQVLTTVLADHRDMENIVKEITSVESGSGLSPLDQTPTALETEEQVSNTDKTLGPQRLAS